MKCLALTSSTSQASIALGDESQVLERSHNIPRGHVEFMNSALESLLQEAGWKLSDLDVIAVDQGPGSFTGIRVSVSIARSLCYTLEKPSYIEGSLNLLAASQKTPVVCGINAFKNLIFCSAFLNPSELSKHTIINPNPSPNQDNGNASNLGSPSTSGQPPQERQDAWVSPSTPKVLSPTQVEEWVCSLGDPAKMTFVGDAWELYRKDFSVQFLQTMKRPALPADHPKASLLVPRALAHQSAWTQDWKLIVPLYLRDSAAEENLRKV